jgi:hypothetical protein
LQPPQCWRLVRGSTQARSQGRSPAAHVSVQAPATQLSLAVQRFWHAPQWSLLVARSKHPPGQAVCDAEHRHPPPLQLPPAHRAPQLPQLSPSDARETQVLKQTTSPLPQGVHWPSAQTSPGWQAWSHAPQCRRSLRESTQKSPQSTRGSRQTTGSLRPHVEQPANATRMSHARPRIDPQCLTGARPAEPAR